MTKWSAGLEAGEQEGRRLRLELKCACARARAHAQRSEVNTRCLPIIFSEKVCLTRLTSLTRLAGPQIAGVPPPPSSQVLITEACGHWPLTTADRRHMSPLAT